MRRILLYILFGNTGLRTREVFVRVRVVGIGSGSGSGRSIQVQVRPLGLGWDSFRSRDLGHSNLD